MENHVTTTTTTIRGHSNGLMAIVLEQANSKNTSIPDVSSTVNNNNASDVSESYVFLHTK